MTHRFRAWVIFFAAATLSPGAELTVKSQGAANDFPLVDQDRAADVIYSTGDFAVVRMAANDFAADVARVTGRTPSVRSELAGAAPAVVIAGTLGRSAPIDDLVRRGKLDTSALNGAWESFVIATVADPFPGVARGLVVAGSDRRGTAFGLYELSQAIGVSPWHWWADVMPEKKPHLFVAAGTEHFGPPSVKYRGLFLNDEDWGLIPWASKTFEPEAGNIGPRTYAKIFELLLRLKANTLWPAMHPTTRPFNSFPANKQVADDYAIVMGSSHAEPMLRNNVGEWTAPPNTFNYLTNRDGVYKYWEDRLRENGKFENIYTLGMRGVHDSGMQGPKTDPERIRTLEQIFADQRELIAKYVRRDAEHVPQMFCAYKEVLGLYRQGLKVPDDVTIVWPDDNFGYVRNFATAAEHRRTGGFGIYYHLSYLGAPLAYLWLYTTPPALVWEEMTKSYEHGARTLWIANVGDLKPAEIGIEFFLQLAWDIKRWPRERLPQFLPSWAAREFGPAAAAEIAAILQEYYRLNYQRKPEHLQWWLPNQTPRPSPLTKEETEQRLAAFAQLQSRAARMQESIPASKRDAFFELVAYPVQGAALANERYFAGEQSALQAGKDPAAAGQWRQRGEAADAKLIALTRTYNEEIAGGKWRGLIALEPADNQWKSFRTLPWSVPTFHEPPAQAEDAGKVGVIALEAERFSRQVDRDGGKWAVIPGLGRTGDSVTVLPTTMPSIAVQDLATAAPRLDYEIELPRAGDFPLSVNLIPTQPIQAGRGLRFGVSLDDGAPREVVCDVRDGSSGWAQGVLNSTVVATTNIHAAAAGRHTLHIYGEDAGVVIDKLVIDCGGLKPSYLGPVATATDTTHTKAP